MNKYLHEYRSKIEVEVIKKCDYIASGSSFFREEIIKHIKNNAKILSLSLAVGVDVNPYVNVKKEYDFVYFSGFIDKAGDDAVEAFAIALKKHPDLKLNMSGAYSESFKNKLDLRIKELGIENNIFFTGSKATHEEVLMQIRKSRYALIPIKLDMVPSTIREAMACGLPVVSTITPGTPFLNKDRDSVLLSEIGDYRGMADNMCLLYEDTNFATKIRDNALLTVKEQYSNEVFMNDWRRAYYAIIDNFKEGKAFPKDMIP